MMTLEVTSNHFFFNLSNRDFMPSLYAFHFLSHILLPFCSIVCPDNFTVALGVIFTAANIEKEK